MATSSTCPIDQERKKEGSGRSGEAMKSGRSKSGFFPDLPLRSPEPPSPPSPAWNLLRVLRHRRKLAATSQLCLTASSEPHTTVHPQQPAVCRSSTSLLTRPGRISAINGDGQFLPFGLGSADVLRLSSQRYGVLRRSVSLSPKQTTSA
ncbi:unnamed protein product, partial [Cuscuta epithymum]